MGDSNIYGVGLDWDQTIAGTLGQRFPSAEILNAAVPSSCPTIEEAKLRYLMGLHGLKADAVILFWMWPISMTNFPSAATRMAACSCEVPNSVNCLKTKTGQTPVIRFFRITWKETLPWLARWFETSANGYGGTVRGLA